MTEKITKEDIEGEIEHLGDYVKMDFLQRTLSKQLDLETRKFVLIRLSGIYEARSMFSDAGKLIMYAADINATYQGQITDYVKAGELFIKSGRLTDADASFSKALVCSSSSEKSKIVETQKEMYKTQARVYLDKGRRKNAMLMFERVLGFPLSGEEKEKVQNELLILYEKLGKVREYCVLKKNIKEK